MMIGMRAYDGPQSAGCVVGWWPSVVCVGKMAAAATNSTTASRSRRYNATTRDGIQRSVALIPLPGPYTHLYDHRCVCCRAVTGKHDTLAYTISA